MPQRPWLARLVYRYCKINHKTKCFSCLKMASVEPVTEQPEQVALDNVPPTQEVPPSAPGMWSSGLCGCCGDIGSCKYTLRKIGFELFEVHFIR